MRCLWLARRCPFPADAGDRIYSANLIRSVADAGAELTVLCGDGPGPPALAGVAWVVVPGQPASGALSLFSRYPRAAFSLAHSPMWRELRRLLRAVAWDVVIVDHGGMGWAAEEISRAGPATLVYLSHNHEATVRPAVAHSLAAGPILRAVLRHDARKYARMERGLVAAAGLITAITEEDARRYRTDAPTVPVVCLPPGYDGPRFAGRRIDCRTPRRAVVLGSFEWVAKRDNLRAFLTAAVPRFAAHDTELLVVGKGAEALAKEFEGQVCRFTGAVESVTPFLLNARIGVVPEQLGGGFKLKSVDYVFHGLPVAALRGALAGLPIEGDAILADGMDELAERILAMIDDTEALDRMQRRAMARCEHAFDWATRGRLLLNALWQLQAGRNAQKNSPA